MDVSFFGPVFSLLIIIGSLLYVLYVKIAKK